LADLRSRLFTLVLGETDSGSAIALDHETKTDEFTTRDPSELFSFGTENFHLGGQKMLAIRSIRRVKRSIAGIVTLNLLLCGAAFGQIQSGVITGVVTDSTGAVVPGANATFGATVEQSTLDRVAWLGFYHFFL
jgi:hypothetical protein